MITWDGYVQLALKSPKPSHRFCLILNPADITLRMVFIIRLQIHVHNYIEHVDLGSVINPRACRRVIAVCLSVCLCLCIDIACLWDTTCISMHMVSVCTDYPLIAYSCLAMVTG